MGCTLRAQAYYLWWLWCEVESHQTVLLSQGYSYQKLSLPNSHFILSLHIKVDQSGKYCLHVKMISIQTSISRLFSSSVLATRVNKMAHLLFHFGKEIIIIQCNALTSMWALSKIRQKKSSFGRFRKRRGGGFCLWNSSRLPNGKLIISSDW